MDGAHTSNNDPELVTEFKIKGAAAREAQQQRTTRDSSSPDSCTICLQPIQERAVAVPCNHLSFDFICLVSWLQEQTTCPLCKANVLEVQYDWRSPDDFKSYRVPSPNSDAAQSQSSSFGSSSATRRRGIARQHLRNRAERNTLVEEDADLERRRRVYRDRLFSLHVGVNRVSQYRDLSPSAFAASPELQSRARIFLRRELRVFTFLDGDARPGGRSRDFLIEYIVAIFKTSDPKGSDGHAQRLVADFVGDENARLLLHELEAWLRSPYARLVDWDRHVQYATHAGEEK